MAHQIKLNIVAEANTQGLDKLKSKLQEIKRDAANVDFTGDLSQSEIQKSVRAAETLQRALQQAYDPKIGTVNIQKFNTLLKKSDMNVKTLYTDLSRMGITGRQAFLTMTGELNMLGHTTKKTSALVAEMQTTMKNTVKWGISSGLWNKMLSTTSQAFNYVKGLDKDLNDIRIVTGKSANEMERFAKTANRAAKDLAVSTRDYTQGALIYYQQGDDDATAQAKAAITAKAANVTGQDMSAVSEQLTAVWNGYQVANEAAREGMSVYEEYVDKMAAVGATTATDLEELSSAMSKVASAASSMGVGFDQLNAQIATIVSVTRQAPESVGTALKTIYARMGDLKVDGVDEFGTKLGEVSTQLKTMGVDVLDSSGQMREMGEVMTEVAQKWDGWTSSQKQAAAVAMAGKRQYNNLIALFDNWDMYGESLTTSMNAADTLTEQQGIAVETLEKKFQRLSTTTEKFYDALINEKSLGGLVDGLTTVVDLVASITQGIGGLGTILPVVGGMLVKSFGKDIGEKAFNKTFEDKMFGAKSKEGYDEAALRSQFGEDIDWIDKKDKAEFDRLAKNRKAISPYEKYMSEEQKEQWNESQRKQIDLSKKRIENNEKLKNLGLLDEEGNLSEKEKKRDAASAVLDVFAKNADKAIALDLENPKELEEKKKELEEKVLISKRDTVKSGIGTLIQFKDEQGKDISNKQMKNGNKGNYESIMQEAQNKIFELVEAGKTTEEIQTELEKFLSTKGVSLRGKVGDDFKEKVQSIIDDEKEIEKINKEISESFNPEELKADMKKYYEEMYDINGDEAEKMARDFINSFNRKMEEGLSAEEAFESVSKQEREKAKETRNVINEQENIDAMQQLANEERDAMEESLAMQATMENLTNVVGNATVAWGALNGVINAFKAASDPTLETGERLKAAFGGLITSVPILIKSIGGLITSIIALNAEENKNIITKLKKIAIDKLDNNTLLSLIRTKGKYTTMTAAQTAAEQGAAGATMSLNAALGILAVAIVAIVAIIYIVVKTFEKYQRNAENAAKKTQMAVEAQEKNTEAARQHKEAVDDLVNSYETLSDKYKEGSLSADQLRQQTFDLLVQHDMQREAVQALSADYEELNKIISGIDYSANEKLLNENIKEQSLQSKNIAAQMKASTKESMRDEEGLDVYQTSAGEALLPAAAGLAAGALTLNPIVGIATGIVLASNGNADDAAMEELMNDYGISVDKNGHIDPDSFNKAMLENYDELYSDLADLGTEEAQELIKLMESQKENVDKYQSLKQEEREIKKEQLLNTTLQEEDINNLDGYQKALNKMIETAKEQDLFETDLEAQIWAENKLLSNLTDKDLAINIALVEKISGKPFSIATKEEISEVEAQLADFNKDEKAFIHKYIDLIVDKDFEKFLKDNEVLYNLFLGENVTSTIEVIFKEENKTDLTDDELDQLFTGGDFEKTTGYSKWDFSQLDYSDKLIAMEDYYKKEQAYLIENREEIIKKQEAIMKQWTDGDKKKDFINKGIKKNVFGNVEDFTNFLEYSKTEKEAEQKAMKDKNYDVKKSSNFGAMVFDNLLSVEGMQEILSQYNISVEQMKELIRQFALTGAEGTTDAEKQALQEVQRLFTLDKDGELIDGNETLIHQLGLAYDYQSSYNTAMDQSESAIKKAENAARDYTEELKKQQAVTKQLSTELSTMSSDYDTITQAQKEYNSSGGLTLKTLLALLDVDSDMLAVLKFENGQLTINKEALKDVVTAKMQKLAIEIEQEKQTQRLLIIQNYFQKQLAEEAILVESLANKWVNAQAKRALYYSDDGKIWNYSENAATDQGMWNSSSGDKINAYLTLEEYNKNKDYYNQLGFEATLAEESSWAMANPTMKLIRKSSEYKAAGTAVDKENVKEFLKTNEANFNQDTINKISSGEYTFEEAFPGFKRTDKMANGLTYGEAYDIIKAEADESGELKKELEENDAAYNAKLEAIKNFANGNYNLDEFFGQESESDRAKSQERKKYDDEFDRYWKIDRTIEKTENELDKLADMESHLFGKELQNNLKQTNKLLENNISQLREKYEIQKQEAAELRSTLSASGVAFDNGNITNYTQATQSALNQYNAVRDAYVAGTASEEDLDAAEKKFSDFKENLDRYSDLFYNDMVETLNDIDDKAREIIENNLKGWEAVIEVELEKEEFERDWNEFQHEIEKDFKKQYENIGKSMALIKKNTGSYKDTMMIELNALATIQEEIKKLERGGTSSMFLSLSEALDAEREQQEKVNSAIQDFNSQAEAAWDTYLEGIDQAYSKLDDFLAKYEEINEQLEYQGQLVELLYGEDAYSLIGDLNAAQMEVGQSEIASLQAALVATQNQLAKTIEGNDDYVTLKEEEREIQSQINEKVLALVELYKNDLLNSVKQVTDELVKSFTGGMSLDYLDEQWERMRDNSESFFNDTEKAYQLLTLSNNIQKDIAGLDDIKDKQKLQALLDKELEQLREKKYLTEYDVKMAQSRLDILKAEIALEDARNSKNSMKLTRGTDGNWSYQYVANEADIREKTQALYDAHNESQQIGQEGVVEASEKLAQISRTYMEKAAEIAQTYEKDSEEYKRRMEELHAWYDEQMHIWSMLQQERAKEYAQANFFAYTYYTGETNQSIIDMMTGYTDNLDAAWAYAVEQLPELQSVAGQMGDAFATENKQKIKDALEEIGGYVGLFQDRVDELSESVGQNFGQDGIAGAISEATSGVADLEKAVKSLCSNEIIKGLNTLRDAFNEINTKIKNTLKNLEYLKDFDIDTSGSKPSNSTSGTTAPNTSTSTNSSSANKTQPVINNPTPTQGAGNSQGNGKLEVGDYVTYTGGYYYYDSYGSAPKGNRGPGKQVKIVKIVDDPNRAYPIAVESTDSAYGWLKASQLTGYDTGGYTGTWGSEGKLAMLHEKEIVLNKKDTANILEAVKATRTDTLDRNIFSRLQNSMQLMAAQLEMTARYNNIAVSQDKDSCSGHVFNITAEFPAANSVAEIREAILSLPGLASQKAGMRSFSRI